MLGEIELWVFRFLKLCSNNICLSFLLRKYMAVLQTYLTFDLGKGDSLPEWLWLGNVVDAVFILVIDSGNQ